MRREQRECHDANLADGSDRANDAQLDAVRGYRNRHRRRCYGVDNGERYGELERLRVRRAKTLAVAESGDGCLAASILRLRGCRGFSFCAGCSG